MPSTKNVRYLNLNNLNMCCSNSATPESESPPLSPMATSSHHNTLCPSPPSIMIKNFNSIYDPTLTSNHSFCSTFFSTTTFFESEPEPEPANFATAFASKRFFFSSPGRSNSLINTPGRSNSLINTSTQHSPPSEIDGGDVEKMKMKKNMSFKGSVAVATDSPDPYVDFRRSMQEMVEARPELMDVKSNWKILHELLLCYLALNPKNTHKFILGAFADLLVSLMSF